MTETNEITQHDAVEQFILYWGDMGSQWGVNRSVAQIHALLFLSREPMNAEQISAALGIARSNVSNSLKELVGWKLIRRVPIPGDRREYFEAETDVWEMAMRIAQGRKEREIDPAAAALTACVEKAETEKNIDPVILKRLLDMQDFMATTNSWYEQMLRVPKPQLKTLIKMGDKVLSVLKIARKGT
ncbi:MAG: MarR family transcriptional regulator [Hyphomicrobiaceae bacterium]|nr:MarR family transcriptional regulator [Hyphomicrobiaceae bacterium]